ncbi:MAG: ankyrin repeat domain-containing protein [Bacilli bacterium]|nr:ankyrin repeat domain-containing protein [Bacilli bacterium]
MPKKIDYQKILNQVVSEYPHNIDAIKQVVEQAKKENNYIKLTFEDIISNKEMTGKEKSELLRFFQYSKREHELIDQDESHHDIKISAISHCIKYDNFSGFQSLALTFFDIGSHYTGTYISKDDAYKSILYSILYNSKENVKSKYLDFMLKNTPEESLNRLFEPYYEAHYLGAVHDENIIKYIIDSNDLNLIKKYLKYVKNINLYLSSAVNTGKTEIVEYFLKQGADINYVIEEPIVGYLTPIKTAIKNNNLEMYQFLVKNGADINLQTFEPDFVNKVLNYKINIKKNSWNGPRESDFEKESWDYDDACQLRFTRESSPLEYATKLLKSKKEKKAYLYKNGSGYFIVYFNGVHQSFKNNLKIDLSEPLHEALDRQKIINDIYNNLPDSKIDNVNYTDLLSFTFISRDIESFNKYAAEIVKNKKDIDLEKLVELFFDFELDNSNIILESFVDLCDKIKPDFKCALKIFEYYIDSEVKWYRNSSFYISDFSESLLKRISEKDRQNICLMPYCRNLKTCKKLLEYGFDINQVDKDGNTILFYLLSIKTRDFSNTEFELFEFLLENMDISIKNNNGVTALYNALQAYDTKDEYVYADVNREHQPTNMEIAATKLISKMNKEDVCDPSIHEVVNWRYWIYPEKDAEGNQNKHDSHGEWMRAEVIYRNHKDLFLALLEKGFVLSDELLALIFKTLYSEKDQERLNKSINIDKTLEFVYEHLDHNTNIQKQNPDSEYNNIMELIKNNNKPILELKNRLIKFNKTISSLKEFLVKDIPLKSNPKRYLEYAKEKYGIDYKKLDEYFILIFMNAINKLSLSELSELLDLCPVFNINAYVIDKNWDDSRLLCNIFDYDEEYNEIHDEDYFEPNSFPITDYGVRGFTGGLMQYAILINNVELADLLHSKGAKYELIVNGEDYTWEYVNSYTMMNQIESATGKQIYGELKDEEVDYYLKLVKQKTKK